MTKATYRRKGLFWTSGSREVKVSPSPSQWEAWQLAPGLAAGAAAENSEPTPSDILLPPKPYLLIILKQCHKLRTKYSNTKNVGITSVK